ncbi:unnamed protein product [Choristocarpus tenellus]
MVQQSCLRRERSWFWWLLQDCLLLAYMEQLRLVTQGFEVLDLVPDNSYVREYTNTARLFNLDPDSDFQPFSTYYTDVDYSDPPVQAEIQATDSTMVEQTHVDGPDSSWLTSFIAWAANTTDYSANIGMPGDYPVYTDKISFYTALAAFLTDGENSRFKGDIVFAVDGAIEISRSNMFVVDADTVPTKIDALEDA